MKRSVFIKLPHASIVRFTYIIIFRNVILREHSQKYKASERKNKLPFLKKLIYVSKNNYMVILAIPYLNSLRTNKA